MPLYLVTGPSVDVVSVDDIKAHLNVNFRDRDNLIAAIRDAAVAHIEGRDGWLGRALMSQVWDLKLSEFDCNPIRLPLPPLIEVQSVTYYDDDNALQTLATPVYEVSGIGGQGRVYLNYGQSWPTIYSRTEAVNIRFRAGYVDTENSPTEGAVPAPIIQGIKLYCGTMYAHRENVVIGQTVMQLPWAAEQLLHPYRVYS